MTKAISAKSQTTTPKTQPASPSGSIKIAGRKIIIGPQAVGKTSGASPEIILKGLKQASKKPIFPPPSFLTTNG